MLAGDLQYAKWSNDTIGKGKGEFFVKTGTSLPLNEGGEEIEDEESGVSTNGIPIFRTVSKRWSFEMEVLNECTDGLTHELVRKMVRSSKDTVYTFANNTHVFTAVGRVVGPKTPDLQTGLIKLKFSGGRILSRI